MKFFLRVLCVFAVISLFACASVRPTVLTESRSGEALEKREIEKTGSRTDVPADKKPRQVVSQTSLKHAGGSVGKIIITRGFWPWSEVDVYTNCAQCHKDASKLVTIEQPKRPWYFWPLVAIGALALIGCVLLFLYLRGLLAPFIKLFKRS